MTLVAYARNLESLYETPKDIPVEFPVPREGLRERFDSLVAGHERNVLREDVSKAFSKPTAFPSPSRPTPRHPTEAVKVADLMGYPGRP